MMTEKAFKSNAIQGICISLVFSFLVIYAYTKDFVQSALAIFCVGYIILTLICIMVLKKWEMGISESVAVVLLIGLSVDYVVHLAAHVANSKQPLMIDKLTETYSEIAISITSAAVTTFGCGAFLFGG